MDWLMQSTEKELVHANKLLDAANKKIDELEQTMDEKDQKIQQLAGMCLIHEDVEKQLRADYNTLMAQAVEFAQNQLNYIPVTDSLAQARKFIDSPEVKAFLEERESL